MRRNTAFLYFCVLCECVLYMRIYEMVTERRALESVARSVDTRTHSIYTVGG